MAIPLEIFYCVGGFSAALFLYGFYIESKTGQAERILIHVITFLSFLFTMGFLLIGIEGSSGWVFVAPYLAYSLLVVLLWEFFNFTYKTFRLIKYVIRPETSNRTGDR